jgi:hypothetical protein
VALNDYIAAVGRSSTAGGARWTTRSRWCVGSAQRGPTATEQPRPGRLSTIASQWQIEPERYVLLSFYPEALQAGYCFIPAHSPHLVFAQTYSAYEEVDNLGRQCFRWWLRYTSVGLDSILRAGPKFILADLQLIAQNMRPKTPSITTAVHWMRDPRPQNPTIGKS